MLSIKTKYKKIQDNNQDAGTYPCLMMAVRGQKFSRKSLVKIFKEIMPKNEYVKKETKKLIDNLETTTNAPEEVEK